MSMLSLIVFLPLAGAVVLAAMPAIGPAVARWAWVAVSAVELVLVGVLWVGYEDPGQNALATQAQRATRSEEHTSELQSRFDLVCRLLLEQKNKQRNKPCTVKV